LPPRARKRKRRVVVDTSVLVAGISGFRTPFIPGRNASADLLNEWVERENFVWLVTEDILDEYKEILRRLGVRPNLIGQVINLIRERAETVKVRSSAEISPDPKDDAFCVCAESGNAEFIVTLNPKDFPEERLKSKVALPSRFTNA
jgi:putative PIN family toxin of toxin-antitoxin system